ncbi:MAG: transposase [Kiritimatiellae bacterium]|nr:transposase [Kiritimatiellia bacterium]
MTRVAKMFKRRLEGMLKWHETFIDNATTEGFNAKADLPK